MRSVHLEIKLFPRPLLFFFTDLNQTLYYLVPICCAIDYRPFLIILALSLGLHLALSSQHRMNFSRHCSRQIPNVFCFINSQ